MTESIRTVLSPLLLISSLCGLRIIKISAGYPKLWFSLLYIPLLWSIYCFFVIDKGISFIPDESADYIIYVSLNIFTVWLSIFLGIYYNKKFRNCLKKLDVVDNTLRKLGTTTNYPKLNKRTIYLGLKFDQVNKHLHKLTTENICGIKRAWESPMLHSPRRQLPSSKHMTWIIIHLHLELQKISHEINSIFEIEMTWKMICYFGFIAEFFRELFTAIFIRYYVTNKRILIITIIILWLSWYISRIVLINYMCERVSAKANATGKVICKILYFSCDVEIRENILQFLLQITQAPLKFCGLRLFKFGYKFLYKVKPHHVHIVSKIDNKPPHFNTFVYFKIHDLLQDAVRVKEIDRENIKLLKKINIIHRLGGSVNCWAPDVKYKSKFEDQERRNNIIMKDNKLILKKICLAESQYPTRTFMRKWKRMHEAVEHHIQKQLAEKNQTKCFFDIGVKEENQKLGRLVFELYDSIAPRTCENFAAFCHGVNGLSYKYTPFHRIVSGYLCQGGDVTKFNGTGGTSIYGDSFDKDTTDSKFNITFKCLRTLNGNKTVFGRVIDGMNNIYKIEGFGTKTGKPMKSVIVLNCGILSTKRAYEVPSML
ncbi:PPIA isomerase, partial [Pseudoatta argentina]